MTQPIPAGYQTVTPSLAFRNTQKAIDLYKQAFGAEVLDVFHNLNGSGIMHATIKIGDSILMMGDENPNCKSATTLGASPISLFIYVTQADQVFKKAIQAGCTEIMGMADMFWGDRVGSVRDPFGYSWMIATHIQDLTTEQIRKNAEVFFSQMGKKS